MAKQSKEYKLHSIKMDIKVTEELDKFCQMSGQTKTFVIEQAIMNYIDEFNELYQKMNKNRADRQ